MKRIAFSFQSWKGLSIVPSEFINSNSLVVFNLAFCDGAHLNIVEGSIQQSLRLSGNVLYGND